MRLGRWFLVGLVAAALCSAVGVLAQAINGTAALAAHDRYLAAWNVQDVTAFAASLQYPHTRQSSATSGKVLWQNAGEYAAEFDFAPVVASGWVRSYWAERTIVHAGSDKVHVAARARRVDGDGRTIQTLQTLYVVAERDGRWGVRARFSAGPPVEGALADASRRAAVDRVEAYLDAVNRRDVEAFAATLHYPHYRVARGGIQVWEQTRDLTSTMRFDRLASTGWNRSEWDAIDPVQVSSDGVNVALELSRYDADGEQIAQFHTLYLVTRQDGRWGIKARSSFAPG